MALKLFLDDNGAKGAEITSVNPDEARGAVESGNDFVDEAVLWIESDDISLTYENITIEQYDTGTGETVNVVYAEDEAGSAGVYASPQTLPDGSYNTAVKIWRKSTAPNVTHAFIREDIRHRVKADEYIA